MSRTSPASVKSEIEVVQNYLLASEKQQDKLRGVAMEIDIDAKLPKLKKEGKFHALRHISKLGQISYLAQAFTGDNTIKKDVIGRYLSAETQARGESTTSIAITPENYKFKDKGVAERNGRPVRILQVSPRKKRVGLFKGELWLDPATFLPVREEGRFVKNPSVFLKRVDFVREYDIVDGLAIPKHIDSVIETRLVGKAELRINFTKFSHVENDVIFANGVAEAQAQPTP
jgi:hypothetical protein